MIGTASAATLFPISTQSLEIDMYIGLGGLLVLILILWLLGVI